MFTTMHCCLLASSALNWHRQNISCHLVRTECALRECRAVKRTRDTSQVCIGTANQTRYWHWVQPVHPNRKRY
jgi:hypothetical protein